MEKYTVNDTRSIETMLAEYNEEAKLLETIDMENATEKELALISSHSQGTAFLEEVRDALDFTNSSTLEVLADFQSLDTQSISLFESGQEYASTITALTNDFDKNFMDMIEATRKEELLPQIMPRNEYLASIDAPLANPAISKELALEADPERTVGDVANALLVVEDVKARYPEYNLNENTILNTLSAILEQNEMGKANVISLDSQEQEQIAEIVESIDGYVLNRSEITAENAKEITSKIEEGNEIAYGSAPPKETTIDPALAHGKVQLEEVNDLGSIEEEKIEAGADLGSLNEKHEEIQESKKNNDTEKKSNKKKSDIER